MKIKKLTPRNSAPVQRKNMATASIDSNDNNANAIVGLLIFNNKLPFAGDDAE